MTAGLVDCHAHLDHFRLPAAELDRELERASISAVLSAGMDEESSRAALQLAGGCVRVLGAVGLHPWNVTDSWADEVRLTAFSEMAADPRCAAISEVGLDTSAIDVPLALQREALTWFIRLAQRHDLAMVLHLQAPVDELLDVWHSIDGRRPRAAIHGFFGTAQEAHRLIDEGFWLSLGTVTTGLLGAGPPIDTEVIRLVPNDRLLLDSDAYVPSAILRSVTQINDGLREWLNGAVALPAATLRDVAGNVAAARGITVQELAETVSQSFRALLGHRVLRTG